MTLEFAQSPRSTIGVEWELALVDVDNGDMRQTAPSVFDALAKDGEPHPHIHPELMQNTVELVSDVETTVRDAMTDLRSAAQEVRVVTDPMRADLMCAGTHPFAAWQRQKITQGPRYETVMERAQIWGRQLLIFGVHVHVGVDSRDKVLPLVRALLTYLPHLQALSASSPFFDGKDTGFASNRAQLFQQLPTAGLPYQFEEWSELEQYVDDMVNTGVIERFKDLRWDIRPSPHFGTIEIRVCDGLTNLAELAAITALIQCLVDYLSGMMDRGETLPSMQTWFISENKWCASRYGLDAKIILDSAGKRGPVRDAIRHLVSVLMPTAERLDCAEELASVLDILEVGASYQRQRDVYNQARAAGESDYAAMEAVVVHLRKEMRADKPLPVGA
ncbi:MAG: glutamate--cysteine ligase [Cellulomonadaceae bacterium]|jgi:carboxylate-amine ligase|nr:glutamate--cysteine ligase [Cellulomonadaceae bacterium]